MRKIATALFFVSLSTFINQSGSANASEVMDPRQGEPVKKSALPARSTVGEKLQGNATR